MTSTATIALTTPSTSDGVLVRTGIEVSIGRATDSPAGVLTEADAAWPRRLRRIVRAGLRHWGRSELAEPAELLTTELLTNALRHGQGSVGVRLFQRGGHLVIAVNDGSSELPVPRNAGPDDEDGRGLLLVEAIADAWGVSDDGTTTWCSLPLSKGSDDMEPVAVTAPVLRELPLDLPGNTGAVNLARINARSLLTVLDWRGSVHLATDILARLVDNAVRHGLPPGDTEQRLEVRLLITETGQLVIDVEDPNPEFPDFDAAVQGEKGRGLWEAKRLGAQVTWFLRQDEVGKAVRATLTPGPVAP
ncbi:ATP-binding protein [Streptomyces sp. SYSU K217416]